MEAIILAGGFGTRLRTVVADLPKPMAPVAGHPFLEILLTALSRQGFKRVVLSLGYMADKITSHFGHQFGTMDIAYVIEDTPLGTGGALRLAMTQCTSDHAFVFNGDTFLDLEVAQVEQQWQARKNPIIVGRHVPDAGRYGRLLTADGVVTGFTEKGDSVPGLINAGCYVITPNLLDAWPLNTRFSFEQEFLMPEVKHRLIELFETSGLFIDIGIPEDFAVAQTLLAGRV